MDTTTRSHFASEAAHFQQGITYLESITASQQSDEPVENLQEILSSRWGDGFLQVRSLLLALTSQSACDTVKDEYLDMLNTLRENPPVWSCFEVISREEDNLFLIQDALYPGEQKLLYAPALHQESPYVFSLLVDTGSILLTHGPAVPIVSLLPDDFRFFLSGFGAAPENPKEFSSEVLSRFPEFISLLEIADKELDAFDSGVIRHYGRHLSGGLDAYAAILEPMKGKEIKGIVRYQYWGLSEESSGQSPWTEQYAGGFPPVFYADTHTNSLYLMTSCREDMAMVCTQLARSCPEIPINIEEYEHSAYPHVMSLCSSLPDFSAPWDHYEKPFMEHIDIELGKFSKYLKLLTEELTALKDEKDYDRINRCEELGVDFHEYEQYLNKSIQHNSTYEVEAQDRPFELEHLRAPDPSLLGYFDESLEDSVLFSLDESQKTINLILELAGNANINKIDTQHLTFTVEDLFTPEFDIMDLTVMNSLFYLLLQAEGKWYSLRSYAVEILKLFGYSLLDDLDMDTAEFIKALSNCAVRRLLPMGILEAQERPKGEVRHRGTYTIRPSSFLTAFLRIADIPD